MISVDQNGIRVGEGWRNLSIKVTLITHR